MAKLPPSTAEIYQNIGRDLRRFAAAVSIVSYQDQQDFGAEIDKLIQAVVKAVLPGRQSNKQVRDLQQTARQAFARALARKTAHIPGGPGAP